MDQVESVLNTLNNLCTSITRFKKTHNDGSRYKSPIIDHYNPEYYEQRAIVGLSKFLSIAENEKEHIQAIRESGIAPKELTTNTPNLLAVWHEFQRSPWPICSIGQLLDCEEEGLVKVDIVAEGGDLWVKVNTIKESRLRAEFREQDSYINSDYDTSDDEDALPTHGVGHSERNGKSAEKALTNSIIDQVIALRRAAKAFQRPMGLPRPRIRYVLNRLEEHPTGGHLDDRIPATFEAIRQMDVELIIGTQPVPPIKPRTHPILAPTQRIMLDLSVVVALCCDSTHYPLPLNTQELEARFRPYHIDETGDKTLVNHTPVTKDLRDQLSWEMAHPVIEEIQDRLGQAGYKTGEVEWYVTQEVKDRTPGIVDLIGGPTEKARVRALYGDSDEDFWLGSRYKGKEGILKNITAKVLQSDLEEAMMGLSMTYHESGFDRGVVSVCERMMGVVEGTSTPKEQGEDQSMPMPLPTTVPKQPRRRARHPKRHTIVPTQRLPSVHTLRTMIVGIKSGMTVLTNNRGAVGKVIREMGVQDGLPFEENVAMVDGEEARGAQRQNATLWVVNPSSLAEWRRLEVEQANAALASGRRRDGTCDEMM